MPQVRILQIEQEKEPCIPMFQKEKPTDDWAKITFYQLQGCSTEK